MKHLALILAGSCLLGAAAYVGGNSKAQPTRLEWIRLAAMADYGGYYLDATGKGYAVKIRAIPPDTVRVEVATIGIDATRAKLQATKIAEAIYNDNTNETWLKVIGNVNIKGE